ADRNRSHWSTSKTPSYTKSVSWQHHRNDLLIRTFLSSEYFDDLPAYILDTETMLMGINRKNRNVNDYNRAIRGN
ncbi:hypothetical protein C6A51_24885, partial [Escherichia coli]